MAQWSVENGGLCEGSGSYHSLIPNGAHFIVLRGVTEDGKILVADPASVKRSNKEWDLRIVTGEASRKVGSAGGPFWVLSP